MINSEQIREKVNEYVKYREKCSGKHNPPRFIPKKAIVIKATSEGEKRGYHASNFRTERGRAYSHFDIPQRAVFRPEPVEINNGQFYLEMKGYGCGGRHLCPFHHSEGDLNFGMYFDIAQKEYDFLTISTENKEIQSQLPIALLQFPRDEFVYQSLRGIGELLGYYSRVKEFGKTDKKIADNLFERCQNKGIEKVMKEIKPHFQGIDHITDEFVTITEPAGYLVRATRCPFRITHVDMLKVSQEDCEEAAHEAGRLYSFMIRKGLLHQVPSQCNITLAGELMDFEDMDYVTNTGEIKKSWKFMAEQFSKKEKIETFRDYLALTLGEHFLGLFVEPFIKGTELGNSPHEVADSVIAMHEEAFKPLL